MIYQNKTALHVENSINVINRLGEVDDNGRFFWAKHLNYTTNFNDFSSPNTQESRLFFEHIFEVIYQNKTTLHVENSINVINRLGEVGDNGLFFGQHT